MVNIIQEVFDCCGANDYQLEYSIFLRVSNFVVNNILAYAWLEQSWNLQNYYFGNGKIDKGVIPANDQILIFINSTLSNVGFENSKYPQIQVWAFNRFGTFNVFSHPKWMCYR